MAAVIPDKKRIRAFESQTALEAWMRAHHDDWPELWLKFYKLNSGVRTVSNSEALDVMLCWGWIDGLKKSCDEKSYLQRYTPRRSKSVWSQINRKHVARLVAAGRMTRHGQAQIDAARKDGRWAAAYAPMRTASAAKLPADLRAAIRLNPRAAKHLTSLSRANLFALAFRTGNMKTPEGRARKIASLVAMLARGETIVPQRPLTGRGPGRARESRGRSGNSDGRPVIRIPKRGR